MLQLFSWSKMWITRQRWIYYLTVTFLFPEHVRPAPFVPGNIIINAIIDRLHHHWRRPHNHRHRPQRCLHRHLWLGQQQPLAGSPLKGDRPPGRSRHRVLELRPAAEPEPRTHPEKVLSCVWTLHRGPQPANGSGFTFSNNRNTTSHCNCFSNSNVDRYSNSNVDVDVDGDGDCDSDLKKEWCSTEHFQRCLHAFSFLSRNTKVCSWKSLIIRCGIFLCKNLLIIDFQMKNMKVSSWIENFLWKQTNYWFAN